MTNFRSILVVLENSSSRAFEAFLFFHSLRRYSNETSANKKLCRFKEPAGRNTYSISIQSPSKIKQVLICGLQIIMINILTKEFDLETAN